ncbi:MAG: metal-sulfur cluster assembly factor [Rhizobacter sp.]|nr:metal-sulfur cluster assembly factor [Rhizobacter sp.]
MATPASFAYEGPAEWLGPIENALKRVVDPEVAMTIVDVGLVYSVHVEPGRWHVVMTMTSAACPVTDVILDEAEEELGRVAPSGTAIDLELVWEPPWTPERMSARAKAFMGW